VLLREPGMESFEIMISESQERMLCVVEPERLPEVEQVCARWEVRCAAVGEVTDGRRLRIFDGDELVGDLPVAALVDDCPLYDLEPAAPAAPVYPSPPRRIEDGASLEETLLALLRSPSLGSKRWAFEQYDSLVGSRSVRADPIAPGGAAQSETADAAVLSLVADGGSGAIAVAVDGNGRRVACEPWVGAAEAVLECARNLACVGAEPLGLTNCLNFGNPEKPHVAWQLTRAVEGLREACLALGVPVVGGNVSLYNEGPEGPILPTPVVGMVGWLPDPARVPGSAFAAEGHAIALVGPFRPALEGSELEKLRGGMAASLRAPDLAEQAVALAALREEARKGAIASAHDVSDGGLEAALAEATEWSGIGAEVDVADARAIVACSPDRAAELPWRQIGRVGGDRVFGHTLAELEEAYS
jgi:phosphoribosylformylglycinamidine synthase